MMQNSQIFFLIPILQQQKKDYLDTAGNKCLTSSLHKCLLNSNSNELRHTENLGYFR